jgi:hypothetical protein
VVWLVVGRSEAFVMKLVENASAIAAIVGLIVKNVIIFYFRLKKKLKIDLFDDLNFLSDDELIKQEKLL